MKIEKVVPEAPPEYHIVLNQGDYHRLIAAAASIKIDDSWAKQFRDFFGELYDNRVITQ